MIERAEVIPETSWSGRARERCIVCSKVAFASEKEAMAARDKIRDERRVRMRHYKGRHPRRYGEKRGRPCGWWHLSRFNKWR